MAGRRELTKLDFPSALRPERMDPEPSSIRTSAMVPSDMIQQDHFHAFRHKRMKSRTCPCAVAYLGRAAVWLHFDRRSNLGT